MRCPSCFLELAGTVPLTVCAVCGVPLIPNVEDVLRHKKFGIVKEVREAQISMAQDVMDLFEAPKPKVLLVEGGTGTGKSFAYLIPALLKLQEANTPIDDPDADVPAQFRVIVSTAKKILQDQLAKDVPMLLKKMGLEFVKWGVVKGKSNYACWKAAKDVPIEDRHEFELFVQVAQQKGKPADKADWPGETPVWWDDVSIENCSSACINYAHCRPHPAKWHLAITNHHVLAYDLAWGPGKMFAPYNTLVIDEAHKAVESFRGAFSSEMRFRYFERLTKQVENDSKLRDHIDYVEAKSYDERGNTHTITVDDLRAAIRGASRSFATLCATASRVANSKRQVDPRMFITELADFRNELGLTHLLTEDIGKAMFREHKATNREDDRTMLMRMNRLTRRLQSGVEFAETLIAFNEGAVGTEGNYVLSLESEKDRKGHEQRSLVLQPLEIGPIVGPKLAVIKNTVITSATLSMTDERERPNFDFRKEQFGMVDPKVPFDIVAKVYASPFDYDHHVLLYVPTHLPLPANYNDNLDARVTWIQEIADEVVKLCVEMQGDTFVLFSSAQDMNDIYAQCKYPLQAAQIPVVLHTSDAAQAQAAYLATPNSVLFGKKSFWEGIDIPGDKLRQVIITKLPFPHPMDPVVSALTDRYGGMNACFDRIMVPPMIDDVRQGIGRLIRTSTDKGVIAILDTRVWAGGGRNSARSVAHLDTVRKSKTPTHRGFGKQLVNSLGLKTKTNDFTILQSYVKYFFAKRVNARKQGAT